MLTYEENAKISEYISEIIKSAESIPIKYESARSEVVRLDDLTNVSKKSPTSKVVG